MKNTNLTSSSGKALNGISLLLLGVGFMRTCTLWLPVERTPSSKVARSESLKAKRSRPLIFESSKMNGFTRGGHNAPESSLKKHREKNPKNCISFLHPHITQKWTKLWEKQEDHNKKFSYLKLLSTYWSSAKHSPRRQEIIITLLQRGDTRITHSHLF